MNRRQLIAAAAAISVTPRPPIRPNRAACDLEEMAGVLAGWESEAVQRENPDWRRACYVSAIEWLPPRRFSVCGRYWPAGIAMAYGYGPRMVSARVQRLALAALEAEGFPSLGRGWSCDRRAWAAFVATDAARVRGILGRLTDPQSRG